MSTNLVIVIYVIFKRRILLGTPVIHDLIWLVLARTTATKQLTLQSTWRQLAQVSYHATANTITPHVHNSPKTIPKIVIL
jgi:hypothetical protein